MRPRHAILISSLIFFNLVSLILLQRETRFVERAIAGLEYKIKDFTNGTLSNEVKFDKLSVESTFPKYTMNTLAVFLKPFSSLGVLNEAPQNVNETLSYHSRSFLANCSQSIPSDSILYFGGKVLLDNKESGLLVLGDRLTQSLELLFFDETKLCKINLRFFVHLGAGDIVIRKLIIESWLSPQSLPIHTALIDENTSLFVDRYSKIYLSNHLSVRKPTFMGQVLALSEENLIFSGGVKSIAILDDTLYTAIAYTDTTTNCSSVKVFNSKLDISNNQLSSTKVIFQMPRCFRKTLDPNLLAAGGRIHLQDNGKMLFSIGNAEIWNGSELETYLDDVGIVIELNMISGEYSVVSRGHRNPQGLTTCRDKIYLSEQGPDGGDEINDLSEGGDFGWPKNSYGRAYNPSSKREGSAFGTHTFGKKPLLSWVPSIGTGDMFCQAEPNNPGLTLWMATLKDKSIHKIYVDENGLVAFDQRISVGERIRDFYQFENYSYYSTDNGSLFLFLYQTIS